MMSLGPEGKGQKGQGQRVRGARGVYSKFTRTYLTITFPIIKYPKDANKICSKTTYLHTFSSIPRYVGDKKMNTKAYLLMSYN